MLIGRRALLGASWGSLAAPALVRAQERALPATPPETIGPFYPPATPAETRADLTRVPGASARAQGELTEVTISVRTRDGRPIRSAILMVWQANAAGRYRHPHDGWTAAALDPGFDGHGLIRTGADGMAGLLTIRPGRYPDDAVPGGWRTPHIHIEVIGEESRLITQIYFPGEPLNDRDRLIARMKAVGRNPAALIARPAPPRLDAQARGFAWTAVLERA